MKTGKQWISILLVFSGAIFLGFFTLSAASFEKQGGQSDYYIFLPVVTQPVVPGKIAFLSNRTGVQNIYLMDEDGTGLVQLTSFVTGTVSQNTAWSPDGTKIAFTHIVTPDATGGIFLIDSDGTDLTQLTAPNYPESDNGPTWSPDGTKIAYIRWTRNITSGSISNLYVINIDGSEQTPLTNHKNAQLLSPDWSPDGNTIIFATALDLSNGIDIINSDGTGQADLLNGPYLNPKYSPDGSEIVVTSFGDWNLWKTNSDGSNLQQLTNNSGVDWAEDWSPTGDKIVFHSVRNENRDIFVINADGSSEIRLTTDPADDWYVSWGGIGN